MDFARKSFVDGILPGLHGPLLASGILVRQGIDSLMDSHPDAREVRATEAC